MTRFALTLLLCSISALTQAKKLDANNPVSFDIAGYAWFNELNGSLETRIPEDNIGTQRLTNNSTTSAVFFGRLEHYVWFLPNLQVGQTQLEHSTQDVTGSRVTLDYSHTDVDLFYNPLDIDMAKISLGLGARIYNGEVKSVIIPNTIEINNVLPMFYGYAQFNSIVDGLSLNIETLIGSNGTDDNYDYRGEIQYITPIHLGLALGYRYLDGKLDDRNDNVRTVSNLEFKGVYFSLSFHL